MIVIEEDSIESRNYQARGSGLSLEQAVHIGGI
jgi:hypothetical protein